MPVKKTNFYFPNNKRDLSQRARDIVLRNPEQFSSLIKDAVEQYFYSQNKNMVEGWLQEQKASPNEVK